MAKTVFVTGSDRGIGRAIAEKFAYQGHRVALHCNTRKNELETVYLQLKDKGCSVMCVSGDVRKEEDVQRMFGQIQDYYGPVQILVNNAGIALKEQLLTDCSISEIQDVLDINTVGSILCAREASIEMVKAKSGSIVNIASYLGICGGSCEVPYSASKAAVIGMTKALAKELAPSGIRVNAIAPGYVPTEMNSEFDADTCRMIRDEIPLGKFASTEDVSEAVYFLAMDETAGHITGQVLAVDGGSSIL